uniref:Uncharacterized protein n=1 Tax=Anopheles coluzzii TaxID=1518534 RepID=A0A8W7PR04_ANOCL
MAGPSGGGWGHGPPPVNKRGRQAPEWLDPANVHGELRYLILAPQKGFAIPKNAFLIEKSLSPFVGPIEPCVPMDQGARYLMKTRSREQFDKLLAIKKLIDGTPVEITSDRARNTVQCVMVTPCLDGLTDEEILAQIEGTKIVEVKRFMRKVDGAVKPTNAYLLRIQELIEERDFFKSQVQSRRKDKHTENADSNHTDSNSDSNAGANSNHDTNMETNVEQNIDTNNTNANNNTNTDANVATQKDSKTSTPIGPKRKASPSSSSYSTVDTTSEEKIPHGNNSTPSKTKSHKRGKRRSNKRKTGFRY